MEKYTGREIAIFTDIHGLLEPTIAILNDINKRGIKEVYSLGDNIGVGPNPREVLDLLKDQKVTSINGNSEEYCILGIEPFEWYFDYSKTLSQMWTNSQLRDDQLIDIEGNRHSYDLSVGGLKVGLCHFCNDVRIDFGANSTWSYQSAISYGMDNPQKQFYYTNSEEQKKEIAKHCNYYERANAGYLSASKDPIFNGKTVDQYDEIFQGHVHFKLLTKDENVFVRTVRAAGMAYGKDPIDYASYIIIKEKEIGYDVEEVLVKFNRESMIKNINTSSMPDKRLIKKFVSEY